MPRYELPPLPYDYAALEPHISGRIMELHHDKHHRAYVEGANRTLDQLEEVRARGSSSGVGQLAQVLAFYVSGHILHSLFWTNLAPKAGGEPPGELGKAIQREFGSFQAFKKQFSDTAADIMGSGWAVLMWDGASRRLLVTQIHDHQSHTIQGAVPLLVLDAWEHAYYLQYENAKTRYFDAVWNLWNWPAVAARLDAASQSRV
ncbi:MAG TPA: superoxide dismutase [Burkholderiales bacterium]|nr:superoxide dismutase [Burkholderiales bacterium]